MLIKPIMYDCLSIPPALTGDNELGTLQCTQPLRKLPHLRSLSMQGNALCSAPTYRSHLLVHLPQLLFLDSMRILPADVQQARESMQVRSGRPEITLTQVMK